MASRRARTTHMASVLAMLVAALAVGACAGNAGVRTIRGDWSGYSPTYLQYAASKGSLPTLVRGEAVSGAKGDEFAGRVLGAMKDRPLGVGPISFEAMTPASDKPPLFVSMIFNPDPSFDSVAACDPIRADRAGGPARPDGTTRGVAAFCSSQRLLSGTVGEAGALSGAADPKFDELVRLVMIDLFPQRDPNIGPGCTSCP